MIHTDGVQVFRRHITLFSDFHQKEKTCEKPFIVNPINSLVKIVVTTFSIVMRVEQ